MTINCPYCSKQLAIQGAKPGRYRPKCTHCGGAFLLSIPEGENAAPVVQSIDPASETKAAPSDPLTAEGQPGKQRLASPQQGHGLVRAARLEESAAPTDTPAPVDAETIAAQALFSDTSPKPTKSAPASSAAASDATLDVPRALPLGKASAAHDAPKLAVAKAMPVAGESRTGGLLQIGQTLGGYKIVSELGHGAMGAVYLAKQLSLDRSVAMKVIQPKYAKDPVFIARFTREAYAAAQLTHHNIIQIYDLGSAGDINFFSMEFVNGQSLADLIAENGKLDVEAAVGFILQAARGLQFAHNQGMVHRDVKPSNLMVNQAGVVKVADLGLVKTPQMAQALDETSPGHAPTTQQLLAASTADVTEVNIAMGTPAYMPPEQAENAAGVDHRADIYSLGCTLYTLITGQPPFQGTTVFEVITKHKSEPMVRPEMIVRRVPPALSDIIMKMVAKKPSDRYANLGEVIRDLENFLGVASAGPFSPTERHAQVLEQSVNQYNGAAMAKVRSFTALGFFAAVAVSALVSLLFSGRWAVGLVVLGFAATLTYFVVSGLRERTTLFDKTRELITSSSVTDWLMWIGGGLVLAAVLYLLGMFWIVLGFAVLGAAFGAAFHFVIDSGLAGQRAEPLKAVEDLLRSLRLRGIEEESLRQFIAKYSGANWEELFEALFGFEAKLSAREHLARTERGRRNPKFRGWREPVIRWIDRHIAAHREAKSRKHLQSVEIANLMAQGMTAAQARQNGALMADALMDEAANARNQATLSLAGGVDPQLAAAKRRTRMKTVLDEARSGKYTSKRRKAGLVTGPLAFALGGKMRFALGCLLILGCILWMNQVGWTEKLSKAAEQAVAAQSLEEVKRVPPADTQPLNWPVVGRFFDSFNPGVAGLVLVVLALFRGWKMSIFALPAAAIMFLGPALGIPGIGAMGGAHATSLVIGLAVAVAGVFFGRTKSE